MPENKDGSSIPFVNESKTVIPTRPRRRGERLPPEEADAKIAAAMQQIQDTLARCTKLTGSNDAGLIGQAIDKLNNNLIPTDLFLFSTANNSEEATAQKIKEAKDEAYQISKALRENLEELKADEEDKIFKEIPALIAKAEKGDILSSEEEACLKEQARDAGFGNSDQRHAYLLTLSIAASQYPDKKDCHKAADAAKNTNNTAVEKSLRAVAARLNSNTRGDFKNEAEKNETFTKARSIARRDAAAILRQNKAWFDQGREKHRASYEIQKTRHEKNSLIRQAKRLVRPVLGDLAAGIDGIIDKCEQFHGQPTSSEEVLARALHMAAEAKKIPSLSVAECAEIARYFILQDTKGIESFKANLITLNRQKEIDQEKANQEKIAADERRLKKNDQEQWECIERSGWIKQSAEAIRQWMRTTENFDIAKFSIATKDFNVTQTASSFTYFHDFDEGGESYTKRIAYAVTASDGKNEHKLQTKDFYKQKEKIYDPDFDYGFNYFFTKESAERACELLLTELADVFALKAAELNRLEQIAAAKEVQEAAERQAILEAMLARKEMETQAARDRVQQMNLETLRQEEMVKAEKARVREQSRLEAEPIIARLNEIKARVAEMFKDQESIASYRFYDREVSDVETRLEMVENYYLSGFDRQKKTKNWDPQTATKELDAIQQVLDSHSKTETLEMAILHKTLNKVIFDRKRDAQLLIVKAGIVEEKQAISNDEIFRPTPRYGSEKNPQTITGFRSRTPKVDGNIISYTISGTDYYFELPPEGMILYGENGLTMVVVTVDKKTNKFVPVAEIHAKSENEIDVSALSRPVAKTKQPEKPAPQMAESNEFAESKTERQLEKIKIDGKKGFWRHQTKSGGTHSGELKNDDKPAFDRYNGPQKERVEIHCKYCKEEGGDPIVGYAQKD